jgi:HSP20 family protein
MRIIVRVKELRKTHNLTQEELAKQLKISRQSLISLEQGRWLPSLPLALQLASFFDTPLEDVINVNQMSGEKVQKEEKPMTKDVGPWSPFQELHDIRDGMNRMIDQSVRFPFGMTTLFPAINIRNDEHSVYLEAHVPGYKQDDIDIDISDDSVTVSGTAQQESSENKEAGYLRQEYQHQSFSRTIGLPFQVKSDEAAARLVNGVLTVTIPKLTEERQKTKRLKPTA